MSEAREIAVFIDADNFKSPDALEHAMQEIKALGDRIIVKHAYGAYSSFKGLEAVFGKYGIRPISNLQTSKNTTDVALAVGAMETICRNPDIKVVAICSGDADFAPLAVRLRELGCKVICFGMETTLFANAEAFYDSVIGIRVVEEASTVGTPPPAPALPSKAVASSPTLSPPPAPAAPVVTVTPVSPLLPSVQQVLNKYPALADGQWHHLAPVIAALRNHGVLGREVKLPQWVGPLGAAFELQPSAAPNRIRYRNATTQKSKAERLTEAKILAAWPDLHDGQWHHLGKVTHALRQRGDLAKNSKFKQWRVVLNPSFDVQPAKAPNQIRYRHATKAPVQPPAPQASTLFSDKFPSPIEQPLTWHVEAKREPLSVLPTDKHRLRLALLQVAAQKICVADVLIAAPELVTGLWTSYSAVGSRLREKGLLHPGSSLLWTLRNKPEAWEITDASQPLAIRYRG